MKQSLILLASLALFACGGNDSADTAVGVAEEMAEEVVEPAGSIVEEAADGMHDHDAMTEAEGVADILQESQDAVDDVDDVEDAMSD